MALLSTDKKELLQVWLCSSTLQQIEV